MFGLNDNQDKTANTDDSASGNDLAAAINSGLSSASLPPNDAASVIPNPIVAPGSAPAAPTVPATSAIPAPPPVLEAVPSPTAPTEPSTQLNADDTMPELSAIDGLNLGTPDEHNTAKKKGGKKKKDATTSAVSLLGGSLAEDELLDIKQKALQSLTPLIDQLEQTPDEKFKTLMMLIQASDNAELVKDAYSAANDITDEKTRAQALLDVVNEINYFTQHQQDQTSEDN